MGYDTAGNIISDAAAELGLGTVADAYGSQDANIVQLRGLLKSGGRAIVLERDWTHLVKEYSFVTRPNWAKGTAYVTSHSAWGISTTYAVGDKVVNAGNLYQCTTAGKSMSDSGGPSGTTSLSIPDNTAAWKYLSTGTMDQVVSGDSYFKCIQNGTSVIAPSSLNYGLSVGGDAGWSLVGNAADYTLPSDFSNMLDQTGWNRTNRLPLGGPVDGQTWQYLKGRQQGVVFNVLFRQTAGLLRLYPDTDTPGGYLIAFEYVSNWWVSATGGTTPTTDAPTANTDILYFDSQLLLRRLKLDWLRAKGFPTQDAKDSYEHRLEGIANTDGSAPVLNLRGRGPFDPLIGVQNIPWTGMGQ